MDLKFHIALPLNDEGLVWRRRQDKDRFMHARDGDMWLTPFQCDWCWFINLTSREPMPGIKLDTRLLGYIRRANLDYFWSRASSTVGANLGWLKKEMKFSRDLGLDPITVPMGPWPLGDQQGFQLSIVILRASQEAGAYQDSHQQFDTIRRLRTIHHHCHDASVDGVMAACHFQGDRGKVYSMSSSPTHSLFHSRFIQGLEERMGKEIRQQKGLSPDVLKPILDMYELNIKKMESGSDVWRLTIMAGSYFALSYGSSLRGNEGLMLEAQGLCKHINTGKSHVKPHVLAPLLGRFKSETGERLILLVLVNESDSGIKFRF